MQVYFGRIQVALLLCCACGSTDVRAQTVFAEPLARASSPFTPAIFDASAPRTSGAAAFGIEALGGTAAAALAYAITLTGPDDCGEDLSCTLRNAEAALLLGTMAAAGGTYAAGRVFDTEPSGWGAVVGALAGAAAVIGLDHMWTDVFPDSDGTRIVVFSVTQGLTTAAASRIGAALR